MSGQLRRAGGSGWESSGTTVKGAAMEGSGNQGPSAFKASGDVAGLAKQLLDPDAWVRACRTACT
ncbi:MAG: hypothetical protein WC709_02585 [Thermoleophilia bacterium]